MPAPPTSTFAVDNSAYVNVTVVSDYCRRVTIQENYDSDTPPTQNYLVRSSASGTGVKKSKGTPHVFTLQNSPGCTYQDGYFKAGDVAGQVKTSAGSITMQQIESSEI